MLKTYILNAVALVTIYLMGILFMIEAGNLPY